MYGIPTTPKNLQGKRYDATDNGDGTYTIHDVEILGELEPGERGNAKAIGREWMEAALAAHMEQLVGGYVAPVHDGHHKLEDKPAVGTFVPMSVRRAKYEGGEMWTLFADVTVSHAVLEEIRAGRWPYRSIEVNWSEGCIASLALMSGVPPTFRYPMLKDVRVLNEQRGALADAPVMAEVARAPGFADVPARLRARTLARLAAEFPPADDEAAKDGAGAEKGAESAQGEDASAKTPPAPTDDSPVMKALAGLSSLMAKLYEHLVGAKEEDRTQPARDEDPATSGEATADTEGDDSGDEPESKEKKHMAQPTVTLDAATASKLEALTGQVTALESERTTLAARVQSLEAELTTTKRSVAIDAAKQKLRAARVVLPPKFEETFTALHAKAPDLFEAQVAVLLESGRRDPPESFVDAMSLSGVSQDEPELAQYATAGNPARLEAARRVQADYRRLKAQCPGSTTTLAEMLTIHMPKASA